jgi:hypothetical protein
MVECQTNWFLLLERIDENKLLKYFTGIYEQVGEDEAEHKIMEGSILI